MAPAGRRYRAGSSTALRSPQFELADVASSPREILVTVVDRFELAAVNGDARGRQQAKLSAKRDKPRTHLADRWPIILAEISNCLVIGNQPPRPLPHRCRPPRSPAA